MTHHVVGHMTATEDVHHHRREHRHRQDHRPRARKRGDRVILACRSHDKTQPVIDEMKQRDRQRQDRVRAARSRRPRVGARVRRGAARAQHPDPRPHQQRRPRGPARHDEGWLRDRRSARTTSATTCSRACCSIGSSRRRARASSTCRASRTTRRRRSTGTRCGSRRRSVDRAARVRGLEARRTCCSRRSSRAGSRARSVTTYAVHPGVVATDVWRRVPAPGPLGDEEVHDHARAGRAVSSIRCATAPELATRDRPLLRPPAARRSSRTRSPTTTSLAAHAVAQIRRVDRATRV